MKKFITSIALTLFSILLVFSSPSPAAEKVTMQLRWYHNFIFAGYYAAAQKGFYSDLGLDVSFIEGSATTSSVDEVLAGKAMYGTSNSKILISRFQEKPVVAMATIFQHSPLVLLTRKNSGVKSLHDLVGEQVFFDKNRDVEIAASFLREGIPFTKLHFVDRNYSVDNYFDTKISGIAAFTTNQPFFLKEKDIPFTVIHPSTYGIDFYGDCLFTTENEIKKHPKRAKAFLEASLMGWEYALKNPEEIIDLLQEKYKAKERREHIRYTAAKVRELVQPNLIEIGHMNPGRWKHMAEIFAELKLIEPNYSMDGFLYNPNPVHDYNRLLKLLIFAIAISIFLSLLTVFLIRFNRRLKIEVDERKRAEKERQEGEEKYRQIYDNLLDVYYEASLDGILLEVSPSVEKITLYTREELIGKPIYDHYLNPSQRDPIVETIIREGSLKDYELNFLNKDGSHLILAINTELIKDNEGHPLKLIGIFRDISERKQAEKKIQLSEEKFRTAFQTSPNVITLTSIEDGTYVDVNNGFTRLLGYHPEEVIGKSALEFNIWNNSKDRDRLVAGLKEKGSVENLEAEFKGKNGQIINGLMSANILDIENKKHLLAVTQDITEKKMAEKKMHLMQYGVDRSIDCIFWMDIEGSFIYVNDSGCSKLGYSREEMLSMKISQIDPKVALDTWPDRLSALKQIKSDMFQSQHLTKNGQIIPVEITSSYITHEGEEGIFSFVRDISDRKQAEIALKESEKKYRNLFESSIDAILLLDLDNGYIDCNPAAFEQFKIKSKDQLIHLTPADLSPKYQPDGTRSSEKASAMITKALETGSNLFEWTHKRLNGEEFIASVLATPLKINNRNILQGTIRDITDYKRSQEMMVQSEKMLSVGGLAAGMAHEINNPLAGVMQTAAVMANRLTNIKIPANIRTAEELGIDLDNIRLFMEKRDILRMLTTINQSGQRMADIVHNMLSFARQTDAEISTKALPQLIDKTLELAATDFDLKKHFDFKTIEIHKKYEKDVPPVPCEGAKIQQVILNILRNGAQAMQEADIKKPMFIVRTNFEKNRNTICIEIEDNGPGMDEKTMKRVFEPFFTTKPVGVGTGLGLSVSYFIITENHGGEMSVESTPGQGSKFIIRLPINGKQR